MIGLGALAAAAYDKTLTETLAKDFGDIFQGKPRDPFYCFQCDCRSGNCYKVILRRTAQKKAKNWRLTCPFHDPDDPKASSLVTHFMQELMKFDSSARVIWDSSSVPGNRSMSIDATVLCGGRCVQFELDGRQHFCDAQQETDERKNTCMTTAGHALMRLHSDDKSEWGKYIADQLQRPTKGVQCSASYRQWLGGLDGEPTLVKHD